MIQEPRQRRSRPWMTPAHFRLIAFLTVSGLATIALLGGFITGNMQPFQLVLSFLIGVVSGSMAGRTSA